MRSYLKSIVNIIILVVLLSACSFAPDVVKFQQKGNDLFGKKRYKEAIVYYEKALELNPNSAALNFNIGLAYRKFNLYKKAIPYFIKAIELEDAEKKQIKYEGLLEEAYKFIYTKEVEVVDSISAYEKFLSTFPSLMVKYALPGRLEELKYFQETAEERLQELIFNEVKLTNVPRAYELYMQYYPNSKYVKEARLLLDTLRFELTEQENTFEAYKEFVTKYPDSAFVDEAQSNLDDLIYEDYKFKESFKAYEEFASLYPDNIHREEAFDKLYAMLKDKDDVELYERFVSKFPDAMQAKEIRAEIDKLRYEEVKKKATFEAYEDFVYSYP